MAEITFKVVVKLVITFSFVVAEITLFKWKNKVHT